MIQELNSWIEQCRNFVGSVNFPPYLDDDWVSERIREIAPRLVDSSPEGFQGYEEIAENLLSGSPSDLGLRLALLYPVQAFRRGFGEPRTPAQYLDSPAAKCFRHLTALCIPEEINELRQLQFELHNAYLAGDWGTTKQLLRLLEKLGAMPDEEVLAIQGYAGFLAVFGLRIQFEWRNEEGYEFFWKWSVPQELDERELESFAFPEVLKPESPAHWLVTAWCVNPKGGRIIGWPPETIDTTRPSLATLDGLTSGTPTAEYVQSLLHKRYRDFDPLPPFVLSDDEKAQLVWAKQHLRDASLVSSSTSLVYSPVLARILFSLGEYGESAELYQRVRTNRTSFSVHSDGATNSGGESYDWELSFMTAVTLRHAGDFDGAFSVLRLGSDYPEIGARWLAARWLSEEGRHDKAAELLVEESESPLALPESWQFSTTLALAKLTAGDDSSESAERFAERLAAKTPEVQRVILGLSAQLWPTFSELTDLSQQHWLYSVAQLHRGSLFPLAEGIEAKTAITEFAWIVEHELKDRVFETFRTAAQAGALRQKALNDQREWRDDKFFKYIGSPMGEITLGVMAIAIDDCQESPIPTYVAFREHIGTVAPRLADKVGILREITAYRNAAVHGGKAHSKAQAISVGKTCRTLLEALLAGRAG